MSGPGPTTAPRGRSPARRRATSDRAPGRTLSRPGDASERQADRAAAVVARGGSVSDWSFSAVPLSADRLVSRQATAPAGAAAPAAAPTQTPGPPDAPPDKAEKDRYSDAASKAADNALDSVLGKQLVDTVTNLPGVRRFAAAAGTPEGIVGLIGGGAAIVGTLAVGGADLPTIPKIPLDFLLPGLSAKLTWKGQVKAPTEVGITITLGPPTKTNAATGATPPPAAPVPGPMGTGPKREDPKGDAERSVDKGIEAGRARAAAGTQRDGLATCARDAFGQGQSVTVVLWPKRVVLPAVPAAGSRPATEPSSGPATGLAPGPSTGDPDEAIRTWGAPPVQREVAPDAGAVTQEANANDIDGAMAGGGRALDRSTRGFMESRFGVDFSSVRIHDDSRAADGARSVDAAAFTTGRDVVFGAGRFEPDTPTGRHLLAHELAHVVQQSGAAPAVQPLQRRGVGEWIGIFLGLEEGNWSDKELTDYLTSVTKTQAIEGSFDSDNKARAIVGRWKKQDPAFTLSGTQRVLLIREMLDGPTLIDDEKAIVDLLVGSTPAEGAAMLGPGGVTLAAIESDVDDDAERVRLTAWLDASFDGGRAAVLKGRVEAVSLTKAKTFEDMTKGGVTEKDSSEKIQLPKDLTDALADAWSKSFPKGRSKEQGGLLIQKPDGSLDWVKSTKSTSGATTLPWDKVPKGATPIVAAHTHPYDKTEGGDLGVTFSGGDLANLVTQSVPLKVVHAGDRYFAVAKTKEFDDLVAASRDTAKLGAKISKDYTTALNGAVGSLADQALEAARTICRTYHLVLYQGGLDGSLTKLDVSR